MGTTLQRLTATTSLFLCFLLGNGMLRSLHAAPIHDAAKGGDAETVYRMITLDPTMLELRDEAGASPLYYAAWNGHTDLVRGLIERGAETTVATTDGLTSLHGGALHGYMEICRILLDNGADVNARSTVQGNTPLHIVWQGGFAEVAALLIERGADVNAVEKWYGMTPLHYAAVYGREDLTKTLLTHGANAQVRDNTGRTPEQLAASTTVAALFSNPGR